MGLFGRNRQKDEVEKEANFSPIEESPVSPVEPKKKERHFPPVPYSSRQPGLDAQPSKFSERLSIATATWSEIGRTSRAPQVEHAPPPPPPQQQQQVPDRTSSARTPPPMTGARRSMPVEPKSKAPVQEPQPARTPPRKFHTPTAGPQRAPTWDEKQADSGVPPSRHGLQRRRTTAQTRYIDMLLQLDTIPRLHNILASFFTWVLLAGYLVFPATFNSLQHNEELDQQFNNGLKAKVLDEVRNAPLLYVAAIACGIGCLGCLWLWQQHHSNYIWVINRIFLPAFMNSIAGLISTLVNVYSAQSGQYSITAKVTMIVTGVCTVIAAGLFLLYNNWALERVKRKHKRETESVERELMGRELEGRGGVQSERRNERSSGGFFAKMKRKANRPGLEPESVV